MTLVSENGSHAPPFQISRWHSRGASFWASMLGPNAIDKYARRLRVYANQARFKPRFL